MADFDPDAYVEKVHGKSDFDPDAYVAEQGAALAPPRAEPVTLDAPGTAAYHFVRHALGGLGDKAMAGIQAATDVLHDKTGKVGFGDAYKRNLAFNDKLVDASDQEHPVGRWAGNLAGGAANAVATAPLFVGGKGAQAASLLARFGRGALAGAGTGAVQALGSSRADGADELADIGRGAVVGGALGGALPLAGAAASPYLARAGEALRNKGGFLKINSIHPVPTLGEKMAELPGGTAAVGRALIDRGIGGWTKAGTAEQLEAASREANGAIGKLAEGYDAAGGAPLDLRGAVENGLERARETASRPTTEAAGNRAAAMLNKYRDIYPEPVPAAEALRVKRELGDEVFGKNEMFKRSADKELSDYAQPLRSAQSDVASKLDSALGPEFASRNLLSRQLAAASMAADRSAARVQTNHLVQGLLPALAGIYGGGMAGHGAAGGLTGLALGAGSLLASKYGAQAGARVLSGAGTVAQRLAANPEALGRFAPALRQALQDGGEGRLMALHHSLSEKEPEYRAKSAEALAAATKP